MLPFSKRPPPPEEYLLRSGDFEALPSQRPHSSYNAPPQHAQQSAPYSIPPAPRAPVFARQAAHTPYGFSQNQQQAYGQYGDLNAPPPPHSLAPMAMTSASRHHSATTGSHSYRSQGTVIVREKPSLKWGVMIALTGALLGGVLGLGMDARRQTARAAAAAEARDSASASTPTMVAAALPQVAPVAAPVARPVVVANALVAPAVVAPPPVAAVLAPAAPVVVTPPKAEKAEAKVARAKAPPPPAPAKHFVAAKVTKPAAEPAPVKETVAKAEKVEKAEKPEPAAKSSKKDANTSDAMKILEAANKDTTNTL